MEYQTQKTLLTNNSIESTVDQEHIQRRPTFLFLISIGGQKKRASRRSQKEITFRTRNYDFAEARETSAIFFCKCRLALFC